MTEKKIACCGLTCTDCGAYIAKRTNNEELRKETAAKWSSSEWTVSPEEINCDGCKSTDSVLFNHCTQCAVRACVTEKGFDNCAHCPDYGCEKLEGILKHLDSTARKTLESIRAAL